MTDSRHYLRWSAPNSEASRALREVVRHEQGAVPSPEQLAAMAAHVHRALQGTIAPPAVAATARTRGLRLSMMLGAAALAGAALLRLTPGEPSPRPTQVAPGPATVEAPHAPAPTPGIVHVDPGAGASPPTASQPAPTLHPDSGARSASTARPLLSVTRAPASSAARSGDMPRPNTAADLSLLLAARRALVVPADALALLERHAREFPRSTFQEEREALAIEALAGVGKHEQAALRAHRFFAAFSDSAYRRRIEAVLDVP